MAIVNAITSSTQFADMFNAYGRSDDFSYIALDALFDYYEELSEDIGEDFQLDVVAICCDWSELELSHLEEDYSHLADSENMPESVEDWAELLSDHTTVITLDNDCLLVRCF